MNTFKILLLVLISLSACKKTDKKPEGSDKAISVYNQAYQENFDADKIDDIIKEAKNAYILIDPFMENNHTRIAELKANGNKVGAYISIGTAEDWRDDYDAMKPFVVTKPWSKWAGEYFVNETTTGILPLMKARIDKIATWGCDWVEFDNMDWVYDDTFREEYEFTASIDDGKIFYQELCDYVHEKGMKCMAKNMTEGADNFDGVLYESYAKEKNWWDVAGAQKFLEDGKLVIVNHYNESDCDEVYTYYKEKYNSDLSYICEDMKLKKYIHYND